MTPILPTFEVTVPVKMAQSATTTSVVTIYTTPVDVRTYVSDITVCNTSGASVTFDVYLVPATGTAGVTNAIFYQCPLIANQTVQWTGSQIMFPGDTVQIKGSTTNTVVSVSGQQAS